MAEEFDPFNEFNEDDDLESVAELDEDLDGGFDELGNSVDERDSQESAVQPGRSSQSADDAPAQKPFMKTPLGMITAAIAVVGVTGISLVFSGLLSPSGQVDQAQAAFQTPEFQPAPVPASAQIQAPAPAAQSPSFPAAQVPSPAQALSPLQAQIARDQGNGQLDTQPQTAQASVAQALPQPPTEGYAAPVELAPVATTQLASVPADDQQNMLIRVLEVLDEQRKGMKQIQQAVDLLAADTSDINKRLKVNEEFQKGLQGQMDEIKAGLKKLTGGDEPVVAANDASSTKPQVNDKAGAQVAEKTPAKEAKPAVIENPAAEGRARINDFVVVESSSSGEMSIIKRHSTNRVFTVFKGEVLNIGGKRHTVEGIKDNGYLVLVGDKLYIDKTLAERPTPIVKSPSVATSKPRTSKTAAVTRDTSKFTLNAIYDSKTSFGVIDDKGEFKSYKVGETIPELGNARVIGLDRNGNLRVGQYIIRSIY